ncbi:GntR family transcriptional regulator [Aquamicrobium terrae]|uniref:DNA-binding LacI/PurR family transcriptional regulator n=1 Tax=Aquamicrobium terrae TaxID=1324945 RepID=A0ABV2MXL5_9HYPH
MRAAPANVVLTALREQIAQLDDGARLPTVRELMRAHRVSQATVQEALGELRQAGLLTSQVGRGTYVVKNGAPVIRAPVAEAPESAPDDRLESLLILSNASLNERCMLVQNHIVEELSRSGSKVVQISYHNTGHLLDILTSIPRFDAAILQSHYESIPIRLLSLLQGKARALVVDGHTVSGVDIDRVGTDWEDALDMALEHLAGMGHRSVALVSLDSMAQPILAVRRAFERAGRRKAQWQETRTIMLRGVHNPTHAVGDALKEALSGLMDGKGRLPFSAMVTLGLSDSFGIRRCLDELGIGRPRDLAVFLLGHHDVPSEHFGVMSIAGSSYLEGARRLIETIRRRLEAPQAAPQIVYLECARTLRESTAAPAP